MCDHKASAAYLTYVRYHESSVAGQNDQWKVEDQGIWWPHLSLDQQTIHTWFLVQLVSFEGFLYVVVSMKRIGIMGFILKLRMFLNNFAFKASTYKVQSLLFPCTSSVASFTSTYFGLIHSILQQCDTEVGHNQINKGAPPGSKLARALWHPVQRVLHRQACRSHIPMTQTRLLCDKWQLVDQMKVEFENLCAWENWTSRLSSCQKTKSQGKTSILRSELKRSVKYKNRRYHVMTTHNESLIN